MVKSKHQSGKTSKNQKLFDTKTKYLVILAFAILFIFVVVFISMFVSSYMISAYNHEQAEVRREIFCSDLSFSIEKENVTESWVNLCLKANKEETSASVLLTFRDGRTLDQETPIFRPDTCRYFAPYINYEELSSITLYSSDCPNVRYVMNDFV